METRTHYHKVGENKRKVSFCILKDLRVTDKRRQKSLLLHLVGRKTQDIFSTFISNSDSFEHALKNYSIILNLKRMP